MKTEREVEMLGLRPYGDWQAGCGNFDRIIPHLRERVCQVSATFCLDFNCEIVEDVFGNLYCFVWYGGIVLTRLDDGAATIIKGINE